MPVTARLSKKFYDRFGDEIANELVDWFNRVDETYRSELREHIDRNYARFEAKFEQRLAELRAELVSKIETTAAESRIYVEKALKEQTRWFIAAWAVQLGALLGAIIPLWYR